MDAGQAHGAGISFSAIPESVRDARRFVAESLADVGADPDTVHDFELVASELVANVVSYGRVERLEVVVSTDTQCWELAVVGGAPTHLEILGDPAVWSIADPAEISGRGLGIVRRLMDEVVVDVSSGEVRITCRRRRPTAPSR